MTRRQESSPPPPYCGMAPPAAGGADPWKARDLLQAVVDASPLAILTLDLEGIVRCWNPAAERLFGWSAAEAIGRPPVFVPASKQQEFATAFARARQGEAITGLERRRQRKDGTFVDVSISTAPLRDQAGRITAVLAMLQDISERKHQERHIQHLTLHDPLTDLPNRSYFQAELERAVARAAPRSTAALLVADVDGLRLCNESLGHCAGDELLAQLAGLLRAGAGPRAFVARLDGDQFGILLEDPGPDGGRRRANELHRRVLGAWLPAGDREWQVSISTGAVVLDGRLSAATVRTLADLALAQAKAAGRGRLVFLEPSSFPEFLRNNHSVWVTRLQGALRESRFLLHYQPVVRLNDGATEHFEALIRLRETDGRLVSPHAFLPAAERCGLSPQIDRWVCDSALDAVTRRRDLRVFVNLSGVSLGSDEFRDDLAWRLREAGDAARRLGFEVTESAAIPDLGRARTWMGELKKLGCRFALDDFGVGFAAFSYLRALPVGFLKIDGSFIRSLEADPASRDMVRAIAAVARALGMRVIAECVEDEAAVPILRQAGVELGQGFLWGRPAELPLLRPRAPVPA